jgi:hypothetical protein
MSVGCKKHVKIKQLTKSVIHPGDVNASLTEAFYVGCFCSAHFSWVDLYNMIIFSYLSNGFSYAAKMALSG